MTDYAEQCEQTAVAKIRKATDALFNLLQRHHGTPEVEGDGPLLRNIANIQRVVCRRFKVSRERLLSERRDYETTRARQIGMYLAIVLTEKSFLKVSRAFGRSDHSTSMWAAKRIQERCVRDWSLAWDVAHLEARFA